MIVFNKPYLTGNEILYIGEALKKQTSGNGEFTKKCHQFFEENYKFKKTLLTTSCTDALEMCAILLEIQPGDEVIIPSYTFVSTANAFVLRGATIVFADSLPNHPNIDSTRIEQLVTSKTKAIVVVHYGGVSVDMDAVMDIARKFNLFVVEDAAQGVHGFYRSKPLGGIGHLGCFSFHETKNIISGEGGMLVINDERFVERAEILWEKGTNRSAFVQGKVDKYSWVDIGSSFLPSEITAAFLFAQLEKLNFIQQKRLQSWNYYLQRLSSICPKYGTSVPAIPTYATHNGHIFYIVARDKSHRELIIKSLKRDNIDAHFHYPPLHQSKFFDRLDPASLQNAVNFSDRILRLPLFVEIENIQLEQVVDSVEQALACS